MKKILLVEDNEHIMDINEWFLKSKGYDIDKAYSLKEADECLKKSLPDVIVLDIMLPDGDGVEYCERIQKKNPITCCIFNTNFTRFMHTTVFWVA